MPCFKEIKVVQFIPRNSADGDKWSHWKVVFTRGVPVPQSNIYVEVDFYFARKGKKKRWIVGRNCQFSHAVKLGDLSNPSDRARFRIMDDGKPETKRLMKEELRSVVGDNKNKNWEEWVNIHGTIEIAALTICVREACLKDI